MTNFKLIPDRSREIILGALRQNAPEFFNTDEYLRLAKLDPKLAEYPGLVCGAFTSFLCAKLEREEDVRKYFEIIEGWAATKDSYIENYLITEVFENVNLPTLGEERFKGNLRPISLQLYKHWMEYPPEDRLSSH